MGNNTTWKADDILKKRYVENPDGSYSPIPLKSKFVQELKKKPVIEGDTYYEQVTSPKTFTGEKITLNVTPMGKPRMTQRDKWLKPPRKPIAQYWKYKDELIAESALNGFKLPESGFHVTFILPMPNSWTDKKRNQMNNSPHQSKPDVDNMVKGLKDCLCESDSHIWDYRITKLWGTHGKIIINEIK